jgi:hypothetical protein
MAPMIELQKGVWKIQAMHICIVIYETPNSFDPNHFEGEIASYTNASTTFTKGHVFVIIIFFGIEPKSKKGFEKGNMHVVIAFKSMIIVLLIFEFQPKFILMFFHTNSIWEL